MTVRCPKRRQLLGGAIIATALPGVAVEAFGAAPPLRLVTTNVPPLVNEHDASRPGALHELVALLCQRMGRRPGVSFYPWKRAIFLAQTMKHTAVFPLTRTPEREDQFRWLAQLYEENYTFLAPRGRSFDVRNPELMKDQRITLMRGAATSVALKEMGFHNIVEARSVDEVHRFMVSGMADAGFGEMAIIRNALRIRRAEDDFDVGEPVRRTTAWLAGSRDFTEADAQKSQAAMQSIMDDGSHAKILKKYRLA